MISKQGNVQQASNVTTVEEAARVLGLTSNRVRKFIREDRLKAQQIGCHIWLVDVDDLKRFSKLPRRNGRPPKK